MLFVIFFTISFWVMMLCIVFSVLGKLAWGITVIAILATAVFVAFFIYMTIYSSKHGLYDVGDYDFERDENEYSNLRTYEGYLSESEFKT